MWAKRSQSYGGAESERKQVQIYVIPGGKKRSKVFLKQSDKVTLLFLH